MNLPLNVQRAIETFAKLPGIGSKSAERLAFYLLKKPEGEIQQMGEAIGNLKQGIRYCDRCKHLTTDELCFVCNNDERDHSVVCIVEGALDLLALEKANQYDGVYHVLHGVISPVDGIGPDELTMAELIKRLQGGGVKEVIFALNPSMEGEATAAYVMRSIEPLNLKVTRIARGIPVGGHLEYADQQTLKRAFEGRNLY